MKNTLLGSLVMVSAITLAGCGSDNNEQEVVIVPPPAAENILPASAQADVAGLLAYMKTQTASNSETVEPINITAATLPVSDTTEPDTSI